MTSGTERPSCSCSTICPSRRRNPVPRLRSTKAVGRQTDRQAAANREGTSSRADDRIGPLSPSASAPFLSTRDLNMRVSSATGLAVLTMLWVIPSPVLGGDGPSSIRAGTKLLDEGDRLADAGSIHRGRHPLQARHRAAPPRAAQDPVQARGEARRDQAREHEGAAPQGDRRGHDARRSFAPTSWP